jgi:hypothetical protein
MSTLHEEVNEAVGKMTMCPYHNEEFILKICSYRKFFKQIKER